MLSAFIVFFAYWHGETVHEEASRFLAMARVLLEYPRWRWGEKLNEAIRTLTDLSRLSDFKLDEHMESLLPGVTKQIPHSLHCANQVEPLASTHETGRAVLGEDAPNEQWCYADGWSRMLDDASINDLFDFDVNTYQDQTLFNLWDTIEFPVEGGYHNWTSL